MNKIILGFVGPLASGKEEVKKYLSLEYNAKDCKFSASLRDILNRANIPVSRDNMQRLSTVLRANFGEDLLAKIIKADASKLEADVVVIDGVRRFTDIEYLKDLPNFFLISIDADVKLRYERLIKRNENEGDDKKTFEEFLKDNDAEADRQVPEVMKAAKYRIINNGTFDELYKQVEEILTQIKSSL